MQRQSLSGAGRTLHFEMVAIEVVVALDRLDDEIAGGKPNRAAPVRVAPKQPGIRFARHIFDPVHVTAGVKFVRIFLVKLRQGANPIGREKFIFIEHVPEHAFEPFARGNRDQSMPMVAFTVCDVP